MRLAFMEPTFGLSPLGHCVYVQYMVDSKQGLCWIHDERKVKKKKNDHEISRKNKHGYLQ